MTPLSLRCLFSVILIVTVITFDMFAAFNAYTDKFLMDSFSFCYSETLIWWQY